MCCIVRICLLLVFIFFSTAAAADSLSLFSEEELLQLQYSEDEWVDELYQYRLDQRDKGERTAGRTRSAESFAPALGPEVAILDPALNGDHYRSLIPLRLLIFLKGRQAPIDIETLVVKGKRGFFTLNITERIRGFMRPPQTGEDADYVIDASIPDIGAGRYQILMSLADTEGNIEEHAAFLEVVKN